MADMKDIVKIGVDLYKGTVQQYSTDEANETLRKALVEANGGSTKMDPRAIRDGKCSAVFSIIEQIIDKAVPEALAKSDFFNNFGDYRNVALGDRALFRVNDANLFTVDEVANGTQAVRRQRLLGEVDTPIKTTMKMVRIYEEMDRVLAGRVDFNHLIDLVVKSFDQKILDDVYTAFNTIVSGNPYAPAAAGTYNEATLLGIIEHVEAAAGGQTATLIGTKTALRPLIAGIQGTDGKNIVDNQGYVGKFYGCPVIAIPQRHVPGTTNFVFDDKVINIVAGAGADDKPVKFVYEGSPLVIYREPKENFDLTYEYLMGIRYGSAVVTSGNNGIGRYTTT